MAKSDGQTLEKLYIELGLDLSKLQADILAADRTVTENLGRLNRERNVIKLRMEAELAGIDKATDATAIFDIQEKSLNQQLSITKDRMAILEAAYKQVANNANSTALAVNRAEQAFLKEKIAVGKLEEQLKHLQAQKVSLDTSNLQSNIDKITAQIGNIRIKAEIDTAKLQGSEKIFETQRIQASALTKELELQRQKLIQLREAMYQSAKANGAGSVQTLNIKSNVLRQIQEINQLETKLKELSNTNISLQIRADTTRQVEQTIRDDIARINARIENIRVKTEIDTSKLGTATSEFDKAKVHVQGLTQELVLQSQKLSDLKKALSMSVSTNGLNNIKTINLQTDIQKQIQEIDRLKAKINELNNISPPKTNGLLSGYLNIKGDITGKLNSITTAFNQLQGSTSSADTAITAVLGVIDSIPKSVGLAAVALVGLPIVFKGIENSIVDLIKASASAGDSVYVMSRGFQMSIADTGKFTAMCKTAGVEVNDLASTIKRTQQQIVRGGDNAKAEQWLQRYGESAFNASGHLKDMNEMTLALSRALKRAQAEGNGMAFILGTMRGASADAITAIEDAEGVYQQAAGLVKNGLANPVLAHEVQGNINFMNLQAGQMKATFESALLPVANEIIPRLTERMGKMTNFIKDNADLIKSFGSAIGNVFLTVEGVVDKAVRGLVSFAGALRDVYNYRDNSLVERYKNDANVQSAEDLFEKELARSYTPQERSAIESNSGLKKRILDYYEGIIADIKQEREKIAKEIEKTNVEWSGSVADISSAAADRFKIEENPEWLKQAESLKKILQETSDIQYKLTHSDYENKKLDTLQWQQDMLNQAEMTEEKRVAIEKLSAAKLAQIEQERADKLAEIRESISSADKTALEQKLDSIEKEKQAWLQAGMEEAEAEQLAQQQKTNYIKGINEQLSAELNSLGQTDLQRKLSQIEQEKQAWIQKGADEEQAERLAQEKIRQAHEETESKLNEIRQSVAALDNTEFENRLAAIEREKNAWIQAGMEKAEAEALAQQKITKTVNDYAKQRAEAEEQYIAQVQAAREEANRKNQQAIADATNILKSEAEEFAAYLKGGEFALEKLQRQKLIDSGVDPKLLEKMTTENYSAYKAAKERTNPLPNFEGPYSPKSVKMPDILMEVPPSFDKVSVSADNAAESLDNLARSAGYKPTEGVDGINDIKAYERPDGSTFITNNPQDLEDDIKNVTSALNELPANVKDAVKEISNVEPTQIPEVEPTEIPEIDSSVISESVQSLSEMPEAVQAANESLNELPQAVLGVMEQISAIEPQQLTENNFSEVEQSLTQLPTVIQTVSESLSELPTAISGLKENLETEITQLFSPMTETLSEVTVRINDFATSLGDFLQKLISGGTTSEQRTPVEVTNNISIEEAHAWDYDHIQELAERVAAVLKPEILSAIGGDDNSY